MQLIANPSKKISVPKHQTPPPLQACTDVSVKQYTGIEVPLYLLASKIENNTASLSVNYNYMLLKAVIFS